jgi:hypothetical protein
MGRNDTAICAICAIAIPIVLIITGIVLLTEHEPTLVDGYITSSTSHWYPCYSYITNGMTVCVDYLCQFTYLNNQTGASIMDLPCSGKVKINIDGNPVRISDIVDRNRHISGLICLIVGCSIVFFYLCVILYNTFTCYEIKPRQTITILPISNIVGWHSFDRYLVETSLPRYSTAHRKTEVLKFYDVNPKACLALHCPDRTPSA